MKNRTWPAVGVILAGTLVLSGCTAPSSAGSLPPLAAEELHELLVSTEEAGLPGGLITGDTYLTGQSISLGVAVDGLQQVGGRCGEALAAAEEAELNTVGAATQTIRSAEGDVVTVLLASVDGDRAESAAELYTDITRFCSADRTERLVDPGTGAEVEISAPDSGTQGHVLRVVDTPALESSTGVLVRELGNHRVHVTGYDTDEETSLAVLDAQVGKLEERLATEHAGS